jgi:hypothetical protein
MKTVEESSGKFGYDQSKTVIMMDRGDHVLEPCAVQ